MTLRPDVLAWLSASGETYTESERVAFRAFTTGWFITRRNDSATLNYRFADTTTSGPSASVAKPNGNIYLLCRNNNGIPDRYTNARLSFWAIGAPLTDAQFTALAALENTLVSAIVP